MKGILRHVPALLGVALLIGAVYVVQKEFRDLKLADIEAALSAIPRIDLLVAAGWTLLAYAILTIYDRLGTQYAGHPVSYGRVAFASFCAYTLAHNLGFAAVSGAAVRYRLYAHWGLTPLQIGKVVAFCSLTFGLGGLVLGGVILFLEPQSIPVLGARIPAWAMYVIGAAMWVAVAAYVTLSRVLGTIRVLGHEVELPGWRMAVVQVVLATVDVAVTAAIFYALLPASAGVAFLPFLGIYVASYTAGLAANLPGGIGVFDTAMLLGLAPYLEPPQIVGAIVVFRLYYYIIPLFFAGTLFAGNEILLRGRGLLAGTAMLPGVQAIGRWSQPDFAVAASVGAVALCGGLLLSLGALQMPHDLSWIVPHWAVVVFNPASEFVPSLIGAVLLVMSFALSRRVTLAWGMTIALLLVAAAFTAARGAQMWVPALLVLTAGMVAPFRAAFYRHTRLLGGPLRVETALPLLALAGCVLVLAAFENRVRMMSTSSWWEVILDAQVPDGLRVSVAASVLIAGLAILRLLRPGRVAHEPWTADARARFAALGGTAPDAADGLIWGEAGRAAMVFRRVDRVLLAFGDPVGAAGDRVSTIWRLRDMAVQEGLNPAVWRASRALLEVYGDLGLAALPLDGAGMPRAEEESDLSHMADSFLVCAAERDLPVLLPLLPGLAAGRELTGEPEDLAPEPSPPGMPLRDSPGRTAERAG